MPASRAVLEPGQAGYPERFAALADAPPRLWVDGVIPDAPAVAIVGSRAADRLGLRLAAQMAADLARGGVVVVSGGARGIDQAAHRGALEGGGRTVMVLGCGLDVDYPRGSAELREQVARSGAVLSELGPDAKPRPANFPRRNRLVSALSLGVVVVQAGERSGALVTARLARELGRPVLAVPGLPGAALTRGTHRLLREGALLVESGADVARELGLDLGDASEAPPAPASTRLSGLRASVARWLEAGPSSADEISRGLDRPVRDVVATLVELELDGLVAGRAGCYERR